MNNQKQRAWLGLALCAAVVCLTAVSGPENQRKPLRPDLPEDVVMEKQQIGIPVLLPEADHQLEDTQPASDAYLGGGRITLLSNQTASQMLSAVIETPEGSVIVVDGGTPGDKDHLAETLRSKGGHVSAWLVTHPHADHIGALNEILNDPESGITIGGLYYHLADLEWYYSRESYRADTVAQFMNTLAAQPQEMLHGEITKNEKIYVDNTEITVMNEPYLFPHNSINNSSVAYTIKMNGKYIVFLGDMGEEAGNRLVKDYGSDNMYCDILQMAHHGQYGVSESVYRILHPKICLWPTPGWLWDNDDGGGPGSGRWFTESTRDWMRKIGVKKHYVIKDGDQIIE